jgi:hypothetical protein
VPSVSDLARPSPAEGPTRCVACDAELPKPADGPDALCDDCVDRVPVFLAKAMSGPFDYLVGLLDGSVVRFREAEPIRGGFVRLLPEEMDEWGLTTPAGQRFPCPRGIDVRLDAIAWCADAPNGT